MSFDIGLFSALLAGCLSFFSPCVLPVVPGYLSFITGFSFEDLTRDRRQAVVWVAFWNSVAFVIGFSLVFIILGAAATTVGAFFRSHLKLLAQVAGAIIILLGVHLTGLYRFPFLLYDKRVHTQEKARGFLGALLAGIFFGFGWTPCVGPILAGILGIAAVSSTVIRGIVLLALYSVGLGIGFVLAALFVNQFLSASKKIQAHLRKVEIASGVLLLLIGALIFTDRLSLVASKLSFLNPEALAVPKTTASTPGQAIPVVLKPVRFNPGPNDFQAQFLHGETLRLSQFGGKIVLVNFWATWCAPCRAEIPGLLDIYREKRGHFEIIGVAEESTWNDVEAFVREMRIDYPVALDPNGGIGEQYKIFAYPTSYLFAPDGSLVREYPGFLSENVLRRDLAEVEKRFAR
ncbi:MAG: redoxin domain-containing protein [Acidobacteria bacterium]|nr:redoxin domain-containing protein [Acidobacteriota bacterium]